MRVGHCQCLCRAFSCGSTFCIAQPRTESRSGCSPDQEVLGHQLGGRRASGCSPHPIISESGVVPWVNTRAQGRNRWLSEPVSRASKRAVCCCKTGKGCFDKGHKRVENDDFDKVVPFCCLSLRHPPRYGFANWGAKLE